MRALADKLDVKAASLYWHVRDRSELLDLLAEGILQGIRRPRRGRGWRDEVVAMSAAVRRRVAGQKDADRILMEGPEELGRSDGLQAPAASLRTARPRSA